MSVLGRAWAGVTGAARWITCQPVAAGVAEHRAGKCVQCPSLVIMRVRGTPYVAGFCGDPLVVKPNTCGCLVIWSDNNTKPTAPAGKTTCDCEQCPQRIW